MTSMYGEPDNPFPTSFTALLMEGLKGDHLQEQAQAPGLFPVQGSLESLVPFSVLSGGGVRKHLASHKLMAERNLRQRVSERMKCLRKLIPSEGKKLSTAEMLEEAYNYVKFMEAQVLILSSMPAPAPAGGLLQTLLNSPAAQAALASNKYCLVPEEQLILLQAPGSA